VGAAPVNNQAQNFDRQLIDGNLSLILTLNNCVIEKSSSK
jgi:hypothetical protein